MDEHKGNSIEDESTSSLFTQLKSCCLELLELVQNPKKRSPALPRLLQLLRASHPDSLQHLFDYTLFPLFLLLDAAIECRTSQKKDSKEKIEPSVSPILHRVSDNVAEAVLQCLEELLKKCQLASVNQMTVLLQKLTSGAMLSPSEASEEFRDGAIRCFRALLVNLHPCLDKSCSCRHSFHLPLLVESEYFQAEASIDLDNFLQSKECLLAFLQSQSASVAVGHWLSLLLIIAGDEAAQGHRGSAKIRVEAFLTLRVLVAKVGIADALAFFLPGVISQLTKVMHVSRLMISGAAGSTEATEHAIRGLAEFLMIVLQDDVNVSDSVMPLGGVTGFQSDENGTAQLFLEELRHLHSKSQNQNEIHREDSGAGAGNGFASKLVFKEKSTESGGTRASLHVERTQDWIERTSGHVDKLLRSTFPKICVHPSKKVRRALLASIRGLLMKCSYTLKRSRLMFLECLYVLVCDDCEEVSVAAQEFLEFYLSSNEEHNVERDVAVILDRLLENLPKMVLGGDEPLAVAHAQQLLAGIYYSGPSFVVNHLLHSPLKAARLLDVFSVCLSQESAFAGSLDKLVLSRPRSSGYLYSIAELKAGSRITLDRQATRSAASFDVPVTHTWVKEVQYPLGIAYKGYDLLCMPPWFAHMGGLKLYQSLSGILRLVGLSLIADSRSEVSLSRIVEIPLGHLHQLVHEVRMKEYNKESWQSWYARTGFGQLLRQASTAVCILNEMICGMSDGAVDVFIQMFHKTREKHEDVEKHDVGSFNQPCRVGCHAINESLWMACHEKAVRHQLIDCVGIILHEYLSPEIWDLPVEHKPSFVQADEAQNTDRHFFRDVIIDGIGIFSVCLGNNFASSGFLRSSLYLLLENLICSVSEVRDASDSVLRIISSTSGFPTVGQLIVANADYIIDSLSRELRHLDLNPHIPNVLASVLSYVGVAHKILPLLEEPMRAVSLELEILGRHRHPELTLPFLKAVAEIAKAAKHEANLLPAQAETYMHDINAKMLDVRKKVQRVKKHRRHFVQISASGDEMDISSSESDDDVAPCGDAEVNVDEWENILFNLNDKKRYRRIVASIASSSLMSVIPLLASKNEAACLIALDIIEDCVITLAKVENAFKHEKETNAAVERVASLCSFTHIKDTLEAAEGADENRLLPAANKIWPFLVACVRNRIPLPVRRCLSVISNVVLICGGDFFSRRFSNDGPHFWKLLATSPLKKKPNLRDERIPLLLPYRNSKTTLEESVSEVSNLKVQSAVLNMIAELTRNKQSASALDVVFKKVSGLVVGIACSGVSGLHDAATNALLGLASIDPDLIWLLLSDVYLSIKKERVPPPLPGLPDLSQILPPPPSSTDFLYVQYGGQSYGFDINVSSVESVFSRLHSQGAFGLQIHR
ncbi:hypothetical protein Nepgr_012513 [Nepenthes gracilis]|uniref:ARM repeat superfamily protein n=1 Tax=Nepenthes gracilis TaxID=150966 RepID=A0AAD3SG89_NEPGR|nr:hypothetical protein Nepgr_012513 [Nepenthes gracilis]